MFYFGMKLNIERIKNVELKYFRIKTDIEWIKSY